MDKPYYSLKIKLIAQKRSNPYSETIRWLRCRLSFSLLRSAIIPSEVRGGTSLLNHDKPNIHCRAHIMINNGVTL